ncbi:PhzF family phenazine biosynthesis protein [Acinetobacter sp. V91_7]|uniref:PhzF family phenazine biosynthesis protein n=1 Tax=unclassified Acinetobacter TaxID=196816 RepID=UPI00287BE5FB|nr:MULTISPECIES: PhzF family phenazine biosynthesis protein [unclassified Acinetobacter]MDS7932550.1 PhzF family phenazine biosynthesis protein [Acinetobacter sp. V91_4B]MDS7963560.1 PhzF family phenazine biosynthesis protein [Acinetobacter sp. V91_7]MDS8027578.1 PhzF family phenazine biosynthesis protein [Acinetobacter sp. V91_13]
MSVVAFKQVDVFTSQAFKGNPVAVIMDASTLTSEQMQAIANWTNLSETTFVLPATDSQADYQVRIFTPQNELPFAGHPTIGTAHALLEAGLITAKEGKLVQQCGAGLVALTVSELNHISFELPQPKITPLDTTQTQKLAEILKCQIDTQWNAALVDVGARWVVLQAVNAEAVLATQPDFAALKQHDLEMKVGGATVYGFYENNDEQKHIEVRSFAPSIGINEDPVCGSGNGSVASFIRYHGILPAQNDQVMSSQGRVLGRDGQLQLNLYQDKILVGGSAVTCIDGIIKL